MKTANKLQTARTLTEQELRNVVGGTRFRDPFARLGDPGGNGNGAAGDINAEPFARKG